MNNKQRKLQNKSIRKVVTGIVNLFGIINIKKCTALVLVCVPDCTEEQVYGNISTCCILDQTISCHNGYLF